MKEILLPEQMSRTKFLKIAASVAGGAFATSVVFDLSPWLDVAQPLREARRSLRIGIRGDPQLREIVRYATLAASGHNAQPWLFHIRDRRIEIHPDMSRRLPSVDPDDREMWMSLGCALENLCHAARAAGFEPEITSPAENSWVQVELKPTASEAGPLFDSIPHRQSTRSAFDGRKLNSDDLANIMSIPVEPGVRLRLFDGGRSLEQVLEYVSSANQIQFADRAFVEELIEWIRFNRREALGSLDGLDSRCLGSPAIPRWIGRQVVGRTTPQNQAATDTELLRSSAGVIVIATDEDSKSAWVRAGQVCQRLALTLTSMNIKTAFLNQPMEVPSIRTQFQAALGFGESLPQLLLRFGFAPPTPLSLRRPVEDVIQWV